MTIKNLSSIRIAQRNFMTAPAHAIPKRVDFEQVVVVLDGDKKSERSLPAALKVAREHQAELIVVHTHLSQSQEYGDLYVKGVKNKLKAEYDAVQAYIYDGTDKFIALISVMDSQKQTCIITPLDRRNWLQRWLSGSVFGEMANMENVHLYEVDLTR